MKVHRNAKTTVHTRELLVSRIRVQHWTPAAAAAAAGISVRTAYKWLGRYRLGGRLALADGSSAPRHQPRRTAADVVARIVAARYQRRTAWQIAVAEQVPRPTVAAILRRAGLNRLARLAPPAPAQRYEHPRPGASDRCLGALVAVLQHPSPTRGARISATVLPFSKSGPVNNLARNHS